MRFRHPDGSTVHLAYCTNVHPAETLDGVLAQLRDHCEPVRRRLGRDRLGIGLWLAKDAARRPGDRPRRPATRLRAELDLRGLEVVTLNGFPYEGFGAERGQVPRLHSPTGPTPNGCATPPTSPGSSPRLLPDDVTEGTISTLPLAWRTAARRRPHGSRPARGADHPRAAPRRPRGADRPLHPHRPRTRARLHRRDHRRRHRPPHRHRPPTASASASTPATSPPPSRTRTPPWTPSPHAGVPVVKSQLSARPARRAPPPARGPRAPSPPSPNPASCTRPAPSPPPACAAPTTSARPSRTAPCPTARPGAPTSTSPCTRPPPRPLTSTLPVLAAALTRWSAARARSPATSRSRPTPGRPSPPS